MQTHNKINKSSAFTLIELLVVISIIGLLSSIALVSINSARAKARDAKRMFDLKQISMAIETSRIDGVPNVETDWGGEEVCGDGWVADDYSAMCSGHSFYHGSKVYMENIPSDPLVNSGYYYYYESYDPNLSPCIYSTSFESAPATAMNFFWCQNGYCDYYNSDTGTFCPAGY